MSSSNVYISRNFTEFGPFTHEEVLDFSKRSIIGKSDFVRLHGADDWVHTDVWVKEKKTAANAPVAVDGEAKKAAPAAAAKKAPAKKAAKKPAKKAASKKAAE